MTGYWLSLLAIWGEFGDQEGGDVNKLHDLIMNEKPQRALQQRELCAAISDNENPPPIVAITSAPRRFLESRETYTLWDRVNGGAMTMPLVFYSEERNNSAFSPECTCTIDIFKAEPWLDDFINAASTPTSALYHNISKYIRTGHRHSSSPTFLVRKVAALNHAVHALRDGTVLVWVDVDCMFMSPPDDQFLYFVRSHDISTIARLPVETTNLETGVIALVVNEKTRRLMRRAVELYRWGMIDISAQCAAMNGTARRLHQPVCSSITLNDVSIFKHLLVGSAEGGMGWRDPTLKIGWFAVGCPEDEHGTAWAGAANLYEARGINFCKNWSTESPRDQRQEREGRDQRGSSRGSSSSSSGSSSASTHLPSNYSVSPFHLAQYIAHMKGGHGVMSSPQYRQQAPAPTLGGG
jgi:hypothetical protein